MYNRPPELHGCRRPDNKDRWLSFCPVENLDDLCGGRGTLENRPGRRSGKEEPAPGRGYVLRSAAPTWEEGLRLVWRDETESARSEEVRVKMKKNLVAILVGCCWFFILLI